MGERLLCKQEAIGSIPFTSTSTLRNPCAKAPCRALAPGFRARRVSLFNNLEEAKRIESFLRGFDAGL